MLVTVAFDMIQCQMALWFIVKICYKQILYTSDCTKKFLKITFDYTTAYQVTVQKSIYTVPCKTKIFNDLSPMPVRFKDDISQTGDSIMGSL